MKPETRTLLKLTGMRDQLRLALSQTFAALDAPSSLTQAFMQHLAELEELAGTCYERHFCEQEIRSLVKLYTSPLGRRLVDEMPTMMEELGEQGRELGLRIARELLGDI